MSRPDVVVVGAGIVGSATAAFLAEAGARVTVVESREVGAGASGRNSGVIQHPFDPALRELHLETLDHYAALAGDGGLAFRLPDQPAGLLLVSRRADAVRRLAGELRRDWPGLDPVELDEAAVRRLEPGLAEGVVACRVAIGYPVPPVAATHGFASRAERAGARSIVGTEVTAIRLESGRVTGADLADGTSIPAGAVVVAAGPWSPAVVDPTGSWRPIRPVWGVVVEVGLADPPHHVLEEAEMDDALGYPDDGAGPVPLAHHDDGPGDPDGPAAPLRPEFSLVTAAGRSSLGSTFLETEPDPTRWIPRLVDHGATFVPAIAAASIGPVRVCARPRSADGRPLLGPIPGLAGAFIASGHGPWGISTGPASARLIADAVLGRSVAIPAALDVARFGVPRGPAEPGLAR